jgi:hypothetical protein
MKITDPEVRILAGISQALQSEYETEDTEWIGSPFAWIREHPSRQRGAIGEKLIAGWLAARGFDVTHCPDSDADRLVQGKRVEVKFSTLWKSGVYKFQQLRDQKYDLAICLGVSPASAHCWVIPKTDILRLWKVEHVISSQHGGANGADTAWISLPAARPPEWMAQYGGTLSSAIRVLSRLTGYQVTSLREELACND